MTAVEYGINTGRSDVLLGFKAFYFLFLCSAFSGSSRPPMMPVFSVISSFLYMIILHVVALHPVYHHSILSPTSSCPFHSAFLHRRIHFSTHDLTNFSVFVRWCLSSFCFHPPCPKPLDWIGVQSNWFSLTFSKSTFQMIPVIEYPPFSTSTFLQHTIPYSTSESLLFFF